MAVQSLKPRIDLIKARYVEDKDRISKETSILYEQAGVNPLAGAANPVSNLAFNTCKFRVCILLSTFVF